MLLELPIHPAIVHFPIALLIIAVVFELLAVIFKKKDFETASKWCLLFGCLGAISAYISGTQAEKSLAEHTESAHEIMEAHEKMGLTVLIGSIILTIFRFLAGEALFSKIKLLYTILLIVLVGFLFRGAYLGGKMVYEHGVGVKKQVISTPVETPPEQGKHEHKDSHKHTH